VITRSTVRTVQQNATMHWLDVTGRNTRGASSSSVLEVYQLSLRVCASAPGSARITTRIVMDFSV
jgi:hypothetical protein